MQPVILSWSGGKDSTASVILAHEHNIRIDEIIMSEVMFDKDFSAENPLHMEWVYNVAKPMFESWGYKVTILRSEKTYLDEFNHIIKGATKHLWHNGLKYGFPVFNRCIIRRDLKVNVINRYMKKFGKDYRQILGICIDEPKRLESMHKNPYMFSLLEEYKFTEEMCKQICQDYGLLSPGYAFSERGGCWICANARKSELAYIRKNHPDVWETVLRLEKEPVAFDRWNPFRGTLHQLDLELELEEGE